MGNGLATLQQMHQADVRAGIALEERMYWLLKYPCGATNFDDWCAVYRAYLVKSLASGRMGYPAGAAMERFRAEWAMSQAAKFI